MGASESTEIRVSFNRPDMFYYAGEHVTGDISFRNMHDKLTLDEIFLEFIGELGYTTRESRRRNDHNGRPHTEYYTQYHQVPFVTHRIPVVQPQQGQREVTLYRGQHSWPFEFALPHCLPPTSLPLRIAYPYVKYYVRVVLDKPWYKLNAKQVYALTVFPRVNPNQTFYAQQPALSTQSNRKKVHLQAHLLENGVVPGAKLSLDVTLNNPKRTEIKRIEATLIQHRQIAHSQQSEVIFRMELPTLRECSDTTLHRVFELTIPPEHLSPTYAYVSQCCGSSLDVAFHYELKLDVRVRGLFTDFKVSLPVVVGTDTSFDAQQLTGCCGDIPMASAPAYVYDEPPPSYESAVANVKQ